MREETASQVLGPYQQLREHTTIAIKSLDTSELLFVFLMNKPPVSCKDIRRCNIQIPLPVKPAKLITKPRMPVVGENLVFVLRRVGLKHGAACDARLALISDCFGCQVQSGGKCKHVEPSEQSDFRPQFLLERTGQQLDELCDADWVVGLRPFIGAELFDGASVTYPGPWVLAKIAK